MHRRYQSSSIPTEIMRSVVGISETGSITKAAKVLGLSQPAISSQIKRIEHVVGGSIFQKSANGSAATELGKLVLIQAKKKIIVKSAQTPPNVSVEYLFAIS